MLQGPWNHAWYLTLDGLLPPTEDPFSLITLEKVGLDQFFQALIFTMVILCFFALVEGKGLAFAKTQIQEELGAILIKNWAVFSPPPSSTSPSSPTSTASSSSTSSSSDG